MPRGDTIQASEPHPLLPYKRAWEPVSISKIDDLFSVPKHRSIMQDVQQVGALLYDPRKRSFEIMGVPHLLRSKRHRQPTGRIARLFPRHRVSWVIRIPEDSSVGEAMYQLLE